MHRCEDELRGLHLMDRCQEKEDEGNYRRNGDVYENKSSSDGSQVGCPKRIHATVRDGEGCEEAKLHSGGGDDPAMRRCAYPYVQKRRPSARRP